MNYFVPREIPPDSQAAFIRLAHPLATVEDIFMIGVGSEFVKNWIAEHIAAVMKTSCPRFWDVPPACHLRRSFLTEGDHPIGATVAPA